MAKKRKSKHVGDPKCESHFGQMYAAVMGSCKGCGNPTASSAFQLCSVCAKKRGKCQVCLKKL